MWWGMVKVLIVLVVVGGGIGESVGGYGGKSG